jgi:prepilin-type N-terminal cleavage/methylation domain-containing protein
MEEKLTFQKETVIKNKKNQKGFTLIELMVVVAIIGVLTLLGLRMYSGQQDKAKDSLLRGNIATIHTLIQSELADNFQTGLQVWNGINDIFASSGIHIPTGNPQTTNITGVSNSAPSFADNGGWVFVFVDDATTPTEFYINGVKSDESGFVFENHLKAGK